MFILLFLVDGYQSTNDGETVNTAADYHGPDKYSSSEVNEDIAPSTYKDGNEANPLNPSVYRTQGSTGVGKGDAEEDGLKAATRYNIDKRGPSSYKLKYGGLGKRKLSSNSLRYGGLGKRLAGDERAPENEAQERELGNGKHLFKTAYFLLAKPYPAGKEMYDAVDDFLAPTSSAYDTSADPSEIPVLAVRQQRSRMGSGMRYAGLGKRRLKV